jgi:hypothetical protein
METKSRKGPKNKKILVSVSGFVGTLAGKKLTGGGGQGGYLLGILTSKAATQIPLVTLALHLTTIQE